LNFRAIKINETSGELFAHTVELWLLQSDIVSGIAPAQDGIAVVFSWRRDADWIVSSRVPGPTYSATTREVPIPLDDLKLVRVSRRSDGAAEFSLDGSSVLTLPDVAAPEYVFTRVVGSRAEFSYQPLASISESLLVAPASRGTVRCQECPSLVYR
jgi:hypothetical protein